MSRLPQDKNRIERSTRESQSIIDGERQAREAKTARLRAQRLSSDVPASNSPVTPRAGITVRKTTKKDAG